MWENDFVQTVLKLGTLSEIPLCEHTFHLPAFFLIWSTPKKQRLQTINLPWNTNSKLKILTYEGLVSALRKATLLIQKREHAHWFLQEQVQQGPVVLVLNHPSVHLFIQILILHRKGTQSRSNFVSQSLFCSLKLFYAITCWLCWFCSFFTKTVTWLVNK